MAKKRKRSSVASFVRHLHSSSNPHDFDTSSNSTHNHNLSAYHPDLDPSTLHPTSLAEYNSLLPQCLVHPTQFSPSMRKYWHHRFSLFSLYSSGILLDEQSWYSVTPESVAFRIAKRCASDKVVVDLFAGAGGNAIQFAMTCGGSVIAVELDEVKVRLGRWNAEVYGVGDRIAYIQGDSIELLDTIRVWRERRENARNGAAEEDEEVWNGIKASDLSNVEAVFLSPPWGGVDYAAQPTSTNPDTATKPPSNSLYSLGSIQPIDGTTLFLCVYNAFRTPNIAYYLPRNTDLNQLSHLATLLTSTPTTPSKPPVHNAPLTKPSPAESPDTLSTPSTPTASAKPHLKATLHPNQHTTLHAPHTKLKLEYQYVNHGTKLSSLTAYYGSLATEWDDEIDDWSKS